MNNIQLNTKKNEGKWFPVIEKLGTMDNGKKSWLAEYAEYHSMYENVGYANPSNIQGMGAVLSAQPSSIPGQTGYGTGVAGSSYGNGGTVGSGDYGQQLLPIAMKIAAHTIGLDLVAVKPTPGPVIDLMYVDYRYDDGVTDHTDNYNPVVFKISGLNVEGTTNVDALSVLIRTQMSTLGVREIQGGLNKRMFYNLPISTANVTRDISLGGSATLAKRLAGTIGVGITAVLDEPNGSKEGIIEFLGFSRIDMSPMFKAYRTTNTAAQGAFIFDKTKNTFGEIESVKAAFELISGVAGLTLDGNTIGLGALVGGTAGAVKVDLISALEDHIFGFVTSNGNHAMTRAQDDKYYAGIIAPNVTTKRVQVGTIEVSSAFQLTEIEDIKTQTGIDIVSKLETVLVNELSQTISKEIVTALFSLGDQNRKSFPGYSASYPTPAGANGFTKFDYDVTAYLVGNAPGGETKQSLQRGLVSKVKMASYFIASEGRVGPATYIVTNGALASVLTEGANYELNKADGSSNAMGQLFPAGKVLGMTIYVDPYMKYGDDRILLGRKNNPDQPGLIFIPYLMAQSVKLISEATFAPRIMLRSRYAVTEIGFFPQKQYATIYVRDANSNLI